MAMPCARCRAPLNEQSICVACSEGHRSPLDQQDKLKAAACYFPAGGLAVFVCIYFLVTKQVVFVKKHALSALLVQASPWLGAICLITSINWTMKLGDNLFVYGFWSAYVGLLIYGAIASLLGRSIFFTREFQDASL